MAQIQGQRLRTQGSLQPLINLNPTSFINMRRAPTSADHAEQSTLWIVNRDINNAPVNTAWINAGSINGADQWVQMILAGGALSGTSIVITPGPSAFTGAFTVTSGVNALALGADGGDHSSTLGSVAGVSATLIQGGTGGITLTPTGAGVVLIGNPTGTGAITLGSSTGAQTVNIALGSTASKTVVIASGTAGNTVGINGGVNTVANVTNINAGASAAASTVNILSGVATAGAQVLNLATGNFAKTVNIATGTLGSTVNVLSGINSVAQVFNLASGASAADSTVNIMNGIATAGTSTLNLASGAYAHSINVGTGAAVVNTIAVGGTGANVITIGDTQTAGSISLGAAMTSGTLNLGSTGVGVGIVTIAGGTGAQTINIAASGTGTKTINVGAPGSLATTNIGSNFGTSRTNIYGGAPNGIYLQATGNVAMDFAADTQASPSATAVINARQAYATYTGFTTAAGASQVFIVTNSQISAASALIVTAINFGANDAQMTVTRVVPGVGTVSITLKNNGAAALNGNVCLSILAFD